MGDETCKCGHDVRHHGRERDMYETESKRELCLVCPGYVKADENTSGYPYGKAWHRFKEATDAR